MSDERRCGRPTGDNKRGRPCRREPLEGMTACSIHATELDYAYREGWVAGVRHGRQIEARVAAVTIERLTASRDAAVRHLGEATKIHGEDGAH